MKKTVIGLFSLATIALIAAEAPASAPQAAPATPDPAPATTVAVEEKSAPNFVNGIVNVQTSASVRLNASIKSPRVCTLKNGEAVKITGKNGNWYEIIAPEKCILFVSGVYVVDGKALCRTKICLNADPSAAPVGYIERGELVKVVKESGYGWLKIQAPEKLRFFIASQLVTADATAVAALVPAKVEQSAGKPAEKVAEKPAETPVADKAAEKPEVKATPAPAADKATEKPGEKAEVKATPVAATAVAKPATKPATTAKPAAKPVAKPAAKPVAKPAAKPVAKPAAKPAAKPEAKKTISAAEKEKIRKWQNDLIADQGADVTQSQGVKSFSGTLMKINGSKLYALVFGNNHVFVCLCDKCAKPMLDKNVTVKGDVFKIPGWTHDLVRADSIVEVK